LDKNGNRINKRNGEDIFTALYNHGIPPGSASVVHYELDLPEELEGEIMIQTQVLYRKFDTEYYRYFSNDENKINDLPIVTLAQDQQNIIISNQVQSKTPVISDWRRWNDYGIGLLRSKAFKQAEQAFEKVAQLGQAEGWVNLTRTYLQQGLITQAQRALNQASKDSEFRYKWQLAYFSGIIDLQNGFINKAIENFSRVYNTEFAAAQKAGFDFSKDYKFVTLYAQTVFQKSKLLKAEEQRIVQKKAKDLLMQVLVMNPEWADAHFSLFQLYTAMGEIDKAKYHKALHLKHKADDNAHDKVIAKARANNKAADHAADTITIYQLTTKSQFLTVNEYVNRHNIEIE